VNTNIGFRCARYSSIKKLGPNETFTDVSQRQEDYGFNSFLKAPIRKFSISNGVKENIGLLSRGSKSNFNEISSSGK